jgi:hypothetical protein
VAVRPYTIHLDRTLVHGFVVTVAVVASWAVIYWTHGNLLVTVVALFGVALTTRLTDWLEWRR